MGLLELNAPIVYRSTDQVYEVTQKYYDEDGDETLPVNVYGRTMMAFERVLLLGTRTNTSLSKKELGGSSAVPSFLLRGHNYYNCNTRSVILRSSLVLGLPTPFAQQGDGEINGTGVEVSGEVLLS
jgi:hypothetical protein